MKPHRIKKQQQLLLYSQAVKQAYFDILKVTKQLLAQIEQEELRLTLVRDERSKTAGGVIIHEFVNPLLYLRLECRPEELFAIHYGFEQILEAHELNNVTAQFTRCIYSLTSKQATGINIEICVKTDWCINTPSAMYEYIEQQQKSHVFALIKHKVTTNQRKRLLNVA